MFITKKKGTANYWKFKALVNLSPFSDAFFLSLFRLLIEGKPPAALTVLGAATGRIFGVNIELSGTVISGCADGFSVDACSINTLSSALGS